MSEGLAQGPYVAARVGFEPATLGTNLPLSDHAPAETLKAKIRMVVSHRCVPQLNKYILLLNYKARHIFTVDIKLDKG